MLSKPLNALTTTVPNLERVTERYGFVPTATVIDELATLGFTPTSQRVGLRGSSALYGKHMVRFQSDARLWSPTDVVRPEAVFLNSHDGSMRAMLAIGFKVFACDNGLVVGANLANVQVKHLGLASDRLQAALAELSTGLTRSLAAVDAMRSRELNVAEEIRFNVEALALREGDANFVDAQRFHESQRIYAGQDGGTLWDVFNRAQSSLLRGGYRLMNADGSLRPSARPVREVGKQVKLNRAVWKLAETFLAPKG